MVSGIAPNTLKLTQKSVLWVRQIISFRTAMPKKNSAQRSVRSRQPFGVRLNTWSNMIAMKERPNNSPTPSTVANSP